MSDGSRRTKTVDGVTTTYHYNNGLLLSQSTGDETLHFYYDSTGKVVSIGYQKGSAAEVGYFFARNAQGDIIAVYRSSDSKLIGTYEYDLWGKPVSITEASAGVDTNGILTKNPFRYRGYYFDEETGFYYLQSRYYDYAIRRFISADSVIAGVGSSVTGHNLFSYCFNNPINMCDPSGCWPQWVIDAYNWLLGISETTVSRGSVTSSGMAVSAKGANITTVTNVGPYSNTISLTDEYAEGAIRGQWKIKSDKEKEGMIGIFGKISRLNYAKETRIGSADIGIGKKQVIDVAVVNLGAGLQYKDGIGLTIEAKASALAGRDTICFDALGWQIEVGVDAYVEGYGYYYSVGALPEGGWGLKQGAIGGPFGYGYIVRVQKK